MGLIVQKYGGVSLLDGAKIKAIARRVSEQKSAGNPIVIVVSAMGRATDQIISTVKAVSENPEPREMDLALSTGETLSAAMLTIALIDIGCEALSLTGLQAGILTDNVYSSASIHSIDEGRIRRALDDNKVVVVTGFQGTTRQGDVTTLGRGGSDTTAIALAAVLKADRCEILKEVPGVFSANPNIVPDAVPIRNLSYGALLEMTFWGAKVLNYRSVEVGSFYSVPLYVGPAHFQDQGTMVKNEVMIQKTEIIALSSHETVLCLKIMGKIPNALTGLRLFLKKKNIPFPQILHAQWAEGNTRVMLTGPSEVLHDIRVSTPELSATEIYSSITATCQGSMQPELLETMTSMLEKEGIGVYSANISSASVSVFVESKWHSKALNVLHKIIRKPLRFD